MKNTPSTQSLPNPADLLSKAIALHRAGKLNDAEVLYKSLLDINPQNADAINLLGTICIQRGDLEEGVRLMEKATAINPNYAEAYNNHGAALLQLKRYSDALVSYDKAIALKPDYAEAFYNRGNALQELGRYDEALASYDKAVGFNPNYATAYNNRGNALNHLKHYPEAVASYDKAIAINPLCAEFYHNRGNVLNSLNRYDEALASYDKALSINPNYAEAHYNRALTLQTMRRYNEALTDYDKALALNPEHAEAYNNRGNILHYLKRFDEALASYDKAVAATPKYTEAYYNHGLALQELGCYGEALVKYDKAIATNPAYPAAHWSKGLTKLTLGEYKEGWKLYEWRWQTKGMEAEVKTFSKPLWLGKESIAGKTILLHTEQGFGDTLQFFRYVPMVETLGAKVLLLAPESLRGLFSTARNSFQLIAEKEPIPEFDFHTPLMSLPLAFGTTVETIPAEPYLEAPPEYIKKWQSILDEKLGKTTYRVGLCWAGGQRLNSMECARVDARRSMHFNQFKPLLDTPNISFISLQLGPPKAQLDDKRVLDISAQLKNWSDTAAVISLLDLVITVDTSVCHLAGAMGKKTWMLNRYDTCWRWLLDRDDSPWYPTLTQFRQETAGDWESVIARVRAELEVALPMTKAKASNSNSAKIHKERAGVLYHQKKYDEALASYDEAITLNPNDAEVYSNQGVILGKLKRYSEAISSYDRAIAIKPDYAEAYFNRGVALHALNRNDEALASYDRAIAIKPDYAEAYYNKGFCLRDLKCYDEALVNYEKSLSLRPDHTDAHLERGFVKLAQGEYEEGWKLYEWRWKSLGVDISQQLGKPLWNGTESLAGKTILLMTEQGFGDALQFCRYIPMVAALGAKIIVLAPDSLHTLFLSLKCSFQIVTDGQPITDFDFYCPLMSLPLAFKTTVETIPAEPYIEAPSEYIEKWRPILNEKLGNGSYRIGLCWAGGQRIERPDCLRIDARRSIHFDMLKPLLGIPNTSFISLQLGPPKAQLDDKRVLDISAQLKNWSDTAAVISLLDLVITVDTSVCHLAGALGKKTWMLNRYDTCWRWFADRNDSPWYPTLTQFRQQTLGDWEGVITRVKVELEKI